MTADPDTPLPFATNYAVTVAATARSAAGRAIASPYSFNFTTPTVRLLSADWYRKTGRADSPAVIALRFNQPVRPADVLAHTTGRYVQHSWTKPTLSAPARDRLAREDAAGLARFDDKVERIARVAASTDHVPLQAAASWDEKRFPPMPSVVVFETRGAPSTDGWLSVTVDGGMPSPDGPERHAGQSSVVRLEPTLFVNDARCSTGCTPGGTNFIGFRRGVTVDALTEALTIAALGSAGAESAVARTPVTPPGNDRTLGVTYISLAQIGYPAQPPASQWLYRIDASLTAADGQVLGYPWLEIVENLHATPYATWTGQVWETRNGAAVPFMIRNVVSASQWVAPMAPADVLPQLIRVRDRLPELAPDVSPNERRLTITADAFEAHGLDLARVLSPSGVGLAWTAIAPTTALPNSAMPPNFGRVQPALIQVTNLGLTVKDSPQSTLMFVTRLDNALPVAGARVTVRTPANSELWSGTTDRDGVAMAPALALRSPANTWQLSYVVTAEKDGDVAWIGSDWTGDVHPSSLGMRYGIDESAEVLRGSVFTDRGVYTKGEDVHVKAVLRGDSPVGMRLLPQGTRVLLTVRDSRGAEVDRRTLAVNRWSSLEWTVRVPTDGALGNYSISATIDTGVAPAPNGPRPPTVSASFMVAAFRRPDFRVDATLTATPPVLGTTLSGTAEARYLFGAPIGSQPARWYVTKQMVERIPDAIRQKYAERQFAFGYRPEAAPGRSLVQRLIDKNDTLDAQGRLKTELPTEAGDDYASIFHLEAEVPNASGQRIANRAEVVLNPASFYVGLGRPAFFVDTRTGLTTSVVAADLSGAARTNVSVTVSLWREQWTSERRPENPGSVTWVRKELAAGEWSVTTGAQPVALSVPLREGGCYILRAVAKDERGRPTRTDVRFYALGGGASSWRADGNRITLVPERATWKPGEMARILVQSPWDHATALVTKEREGIRTHTRVDVTSTQDAIEVPISDADVPNVFVSVVLVKGRTSGDVGPEGDDPGRPAFRVGYVELTIDDASKRLKVDVRADREEYRPRQPVTVSVSVADAEERPSAGEVTLWAVDYGLLSLTDYKAPDVARAIYARKQLQVQTQDNRLRLIAKRTVVTEREVQGQVGAGAGGGGRGGGLAGGVVQGIPAPPPPPPPDGFFTQTLPRLDAVEEAKLQPGEIRTDFRSLVFWLGSATTDADGRATTTVTLPDSVTTYRIMAVAGDLSSHFGAADTEIRATKPLTMLPAFPRFLSSGDRASFGAIVTNNTARAGDAIVTIRSLDPARVRFGAEMTRTVRLAAGESQAVRFASTAQSDGSARVRMSVALGGETDAFELALPVTAPLRLETVAAYGDTIASATEQFRLPANARPDKGGLGISLASTALVGLGESARYLDEYPYDCAEQKASRALALLLSADLGGAFPMANVKPDELRAAGLTALKDLSTYQCPDGGFGMFPGSCYGPSSAYLTAYIIDVMQRADGLSATPDRFAIDRALSFLQSQLRQAPPEAQWWPAWAASQAYAVKVLAAGGRNVQADLTRLLPMADRMPVFALSYVADAMASSGDRGPRYQDLIRRITNALRVDADRAHVEEIDDAALLWLWNTNVRATAVVLDGLSRRSDDATFAAPLARWLLAARENGRWGTTHENATALGALVNYYKTFETAIPNMTAAVTLGGRTLGQATFAGRTTTAQQVRLEMSDLVKQVAGATVQDLVVSRTGTGRVYYTARLQYAPTSPPEPVDRGIRVERRYQRYSPDALGSASTTFAEGDLVRVTLSIALPHEGRFLAFTDPIPAGFEAVDGSLKTTATDLGAVSTTQSSDADRYAWWRRGGFDFVEKHDDKVVAFATRLAAGRHEFTYLVRATTAGTFSAAGTFAEAMYAPEIMGRGPRVTITVK